MMQGVLIKVEGWVKKNEIEHGSHSENGTCFFERSPANQGGDQGTGSKNLSQDKEENKTGGRFVRTINMFERKAITKRVSTG